MFRKITDDEIIFDLSEYAHNLGKELYVVGGAVRDCVMGNEKKSITFDFDLTSSLTFDEIQEFAKQKGLQLEVKNRKLEVVSLRRNSSIIYEHARMRVENYSDKFSHNPSEVWFTDKIEEDAKRRDFTVNAMYYVRHSMRLIDPFCALKDIDEKRLRTVLRPEETFAVDPSRILRMVELFARFGFSIDDETLMVANNCAGNVKKLSKSRLERELSRINTTGKYGEDITIYNARKDEIINKLGLSWIQSL